ncbi:MAG: OmpA family protein [Alphaproteobacteria bacterium]
MRKVILLFIGILLMSSTGLLAQRTKGPGQVHERSKEIIYIEKIVEVPQQTTIIDININMCNEAYRRQTIIYCASHDSCRTTSSIEVLMAIDPMMTLSCRALFYNSKLVSIQSGIDVHKRCLDAHGLYDLNKNICKFTVELRRKTKVLETAVVWENENHICGKELFPNSAKKRRNTIVGVGLGSAALGAVGGGYLYQRVIGYHYNVKEVLRDKCGITDKAQLKEMAKNIRDEKHTYIPELAADLVAHGVPDPVAHECIAELNREAFYGELKTTFSETEAIITRETNGNFSLEIPESIKNPVLFGTNESILKPTVSGTLLLDKIVNFVLKYSCIKVELTGMTSKLGTSQRNEVLALERATVVKRYFIEKGITPTQITILPQQGDFGVGANDNDQAYRSTRFHFDIAACSSGANADQVYVDDAEFESDDEINVEKTRFYKKSDFVKGAVIGGVGTGALGAGIAALATKNMKCYISGDDNVLAKWKKAFSIRP